MLETLKSVFDTFGSAVFVPVMIFVVAKVLKVKTQKAFLSGLYAGVGLMGFTLILNSYTPIISKVVQQMVDQTGINLPAFDVGWQATALVAYSTEAGMIYLVIALVLQTVLFLVKWTNVFQPSDLWNNYSYMVWGSMVYLATKNMILAVVLMCLLNMYSLLLSEMLARRWSSYYHYPNCTIIAMHNIEPGIFALIMDPIWNMLGLHKVRFKSSRVAEEAGLFRRTDLIRVVLRSIFRNFRKYQQLSGIIGVGTNHRSSDRNKCGNGNLSESGGNLLTSLQSDLTGS